MRLRRGVRRGPGPGPRHRGRQDRGRVRIRPHPRGHQHTFVRGGLFLLFYWFDCMKVYDIEIFGHRLNTHLAYQRINFEQSTEFPNPPRPLPSSRAARSEVAPRR